jgi:hypothetical protein
MMTKFQIFSDEGEHQIKVKAKSKVDELDGRVTQLNQKVDQRKDVTSETRKLTSTAPNKSANFEIFSDSVQSHPPSASSVTLPSKNAIAVKSSTFEIFSDNPVNLRASNKQESQTNEFKGKERAENSNLDIKKLPHKPTTLKIYSDKASELAVQEISMSQTKTDNTKPKFQIFSDDGEQNIEKSKNEDDDLDDVLTAMGILDNEDGTINTRFVS